MTKAKESIANEDLELVKIIENLIFFMIYTQDMYSN